VHFEALTLRLTVELRRTRKLAEGPILCFSYFKVDLFRFLTYIYIYLPEKNKLHYLCWTRNLIHSRQWPLTTLVYVLYVFYLAISGNSNSIFHIGRVNMIRLISHIHLYKTSTPSGAQRTSSPLWRVWRSWFSFLAIDTLSKYDFFDLNYSEQTANLNLYRLY
jgi:hypothetical protein